MVVTGFKCNDCKYEGKKEELSKSESKCPKCGSLNWSFITEDEADGGEAIYGR